MAETYRFRCEDAFGNYSAPEIVSHIEHADDPIEVVKGIAKNTEYLFESERDELLDPEDASTPIGALHANVEHALDELRLIGWNETETVSDHTFIRAMDFLDQLDQDVELDLAPIYAPLLVRTDEWGEFRKELWKQTLFRVVAATAEYLLRDRGWGELLDTQRHGCFRATFTLEVTLEPDDLTLAEGTDLGEIAEDAALETIHDSPFFDTKADLMEELEFAGISRR